METGFTIIHFNVGLEMVIFYIFSNKMCTFANIAKGIWKRLNTYINILLFRYELSWFRINDDKKIYQT